MTETKVTAKLKNLDIAPRKVRRAIAPLKGLQVEDALAELSINRMRSAVPLAKLIYSAIANAKNKKLDPDKLIVDSIRVDEGRALKRLIPQGRGRASLIKKRFSHVTLELSVSERAKPKGFVMPKKIKKIKETRGSSRSTPKPKEEVKEKVREKKGFMQKIFRRKAV